MLIIDDELIFCTTPHNILPSTSKVIPGYLTLAHKHKQYIPSFSPTLFTHHIPQTSHNPPKTNPYIPTHKLVNQGGVGGAVLPSAQNSIRNWAGF